MNELGSKSEPFLFVIDFSLMNPLVLRLDEIKQAGILFQVHEKRNFTVISPDRVPFSFVRVPVSHDVYTRAFDQVMEHIQAGDTFLLNLTFPTKILTGLSLWEIFHRSTARYKLLIPDEFVVFSPEIFIRIRNGKISSFPMKGTIDATMPDAKSILLGNRKELAEHYTIVDLIRNDLNLVAKEVRVERFRYIEEIETNFTRLLQASSEISGKLPDNYKSCLGDILYKMLPAGSVTGAPKKKTVEIIREAETYERGYYTGVMGYFDGSTLDSGVMIRFIENTPEGLIFKSGGGVTSQSLCDEEYKELIDKVYVPFT